MTQTQLVLQLGKAKREGTLDRLLADVAKARLLVLDEFGYVPFDVDGARLLYQVISDSYERPAIWSQGQFRRLLIGTLKTGYGIKGANGHLFCER